MRVKFKLQLGCNQRWQAGGRHRGWLRFVLLLGALLLPAACCQLLLLLPNTTLTNVNPLRRCQWPNTSQQSPAELPRLPYCPCVRSFVFTCCCRDCVLAATCNLIGQRRRRLSQRQLVKCNDLDLPARQMGVRTANCQSAACTGAGVGQLATT